MMARTLRGGFSDLRDANAIVNEVRLTLRLQILLCYFTDVHIAL